METTVGYADELKKLINIATHPRVQSLLQKALTDVEAQVDVVASASVKPSELNGESGIEPRESEKELPENEVEHDGNEIAANAGESELKENEVESVENGMEFKESNVEANKSEVELSADKSSTPEQSSSVDDTSGKVVMNRKKLIRITNYGWDQSEKYVKIYIHDMEGVKKENIHAEFHTKDMRVEILDVSGKDYVFSINDLYNDIIPEECSAKAKSGLVIIRMRTVTSENWQFLTARERKLKEINDQRAAEDPEDPTKSIMTIIRRMYQNADDETRQKIAKAWQDSQNSFVGSDDDLDF